jgi:hypothetical protein
VVWVGRAIFATKINEMIFNSKQKHGLEHSFGLPQSRRNLAHHASLFPFPEPRGSVAELRGSVAELRGSVTEPRGSVTEPRGSAPEPRGSVAEPRGSAPEPRGSAPEPRVAGAEPLGSGTETGGRDVRIWWVADPAIYLCVSNLVFI